MANECPTCKGLGYVTVVQEMTYEETCPNCQGHGKVFKEDAYANLTSRETSKG